MICFFFALVVSFYSWMIFNPVEKIAPNLSFFENLQRIRDVGVEISEPVANYSNVTTVNNEESLESDFGKPKTKLKLPKPDTLVEYKSLPWREYISKEGKYTLQVYVQSRLLLTDVEIALRITSPLREKLIKRLDLLSGGILCVSFKAFF